MRIKKFTASNYSIALREVKQELGEDAIILSTRSIKPPTLMAGRKGATRVEITAAVEYSSPVITPQFSDIQEILSGAKLHLKFPNLPHKEDFDFVGLQTESHGILIWSV